MSLSESKLMAVYELVIMSCASNAGPSADSVVPELGSWSSLTTAAGFSISVVACTVLVVAVVVVASSSSSSITDGFSAGRDMFAKCSKPEQNCPRDVVFVSHSVENAVTFPNSKRKQVVLRFSAAITALLSLACIHSFSERSLELIMNLNAENEKMFPASKKITVAATSSLVDLKAELLKRRQEAMGRSADLNAPNLTKSAKSSSINQPKWKVMADKLESEGKLKEIRRDPAAMGQSSKQSKAERDREEEDNNLSDNLRKSREALERKSRLYEKRYREAREEVANTSDMSDDEQLVDFHRKVKADTSTAKVDEVIKSASRSRSPSPTPHGDYGDDADWVEFTDSMGRTRKVLRQDVDYYKRIDQEAVRDTRPADDRRSPERDRRSDREDEQRSDEEDDEPEQVQPVRYKNMQQNEVREHGVAYYSFSADDEERRKQLDMLNKMRDQTKKQRDTREQVKKKRKQLLNERLAKVAARKGVPFVPKESSSSESEEDEIKPSTSRRDDAVLARKEDYARDWDVGKRTDGGRTVERSEEPSEHENYVASIRRRAEESYANFVKSSSSDAHKSDFDEQPKKRRTMQEAAKNYTEKQREERNEAFAPPSAYFFDAPRAPRPHGFQSKQTSRRPAPFSAAQFRADVPPPPLPAGVGNSPQVPADVTSVISEKLAFFRNQQM